MKKVLLTVLVAGLMASTASAATLSLAFPGLDEAAPGGTVNVDVVWEFTPDLGYGNNDIAAVIFQLNAANAALTDQSTAVPNWVVSGTSGPLSGSHQFASSANLGGQITGPGQFIVGTMEITVDPSAQNGDIIELTFMHSSILLPSSPTGAGYSYPAKADEVGKAASYSGVYAYGVGGPRTATSKDVTIQDANPLLLKVVPEPASLALLAIGGLALIRRR